MTYKKPINYANKPRSPKPPVVRFDWTDEQIKHLTECSASLNLNDGEIFSEKEFIANLAQAYGNGAGVTEKQAAQLEKIYKRRVLCTPDRSRHDK